MKRSFLVLILMFIATPQAFAEQDRCPCFNDLQIAGTCVHADEIQFEAGKLLCHWSVLSGFVGSEWSYLVDTRHDGPFCDVQWYVTDYRRGDNNRPAIGPLTNYQQDDCMDQIESAAEMLK